MTLEISVLIGGVTLALALYKGIAELKRAQREETKNDSAQMTTVIVKLENISSDVSEIKNDLKDVKTEQNVLRERVVKTEMKVDAMHNREDSRDIAYKELLQKISEMESKLK